MSLLNEPLEPDFCLYEVRTPDMAHALVLADSEPAALAAAKAVAEEFANWPSSQIEVFRMESDLDRPGVIWWTD